MAPSLPDTKNLYSHLEKVWIPRTTEADPPGAAHPPRHLGKMARLLENTTTQVPTQQHGFLGQATQQKAGGQKHALQLGSETLPAVCLWARLSASLSLGFFLLQGSPLLRLG